MGFSVGSYARVWSAEDKGKYSVCNVSISKKNKETDKYETEFQDGFVRFVGNAHTSISNMKIPKNGVSIKISACDVTSKYDTEKKKTFVNFVIFGFETDANNGGNSKSKSKLENEYDERFETGLGNDDGFDDDVPF